MSAGADVAKLFKPKRCAVNLLQLLNGLTAEDTGCFKDQAGKLIA